MEDFYLFTKVSQVFGQLSIQCEARDAIFELIFYNYKDNIPYIYESGLNVFLDHPLIDNNYKVRVMNTIRLFWNQIMIIRSSDFSISLQEINPYRDIMPTFSYDFRIKEFRIELLLEYPFDGRKFRAYLLRIKRSGKLICGCITSYKIMILWSDFLYDKINSDSYNRFSFLVYN